MSGAARLAIVKNSSRCRDSACGFWHEPQRLLCTSNAELAIYRLRSIDLVDQKLNDATRCG